MVPPCNLATGRLHIPNPPAELNIPCPNGGTNMDGGSQVEDTICSSDLPKRVFSHSRFNSFVSFFVSGFFFNLMNESSIRSRRRPMSASYFTMWSRPSRNTSARLQWVFFLCSDVKKNAYWQTPNLKAYAASARATEFCRRYEELDFLASIEKPFVWTDPAEVRVCVCFKRFWGHA